jgi:N6-L-threonylcarbamoyladenine synthase
MKGSEAALFLGLDTSCYSTSVALVDQSGNLIFERRRLLPVAAGEKGLRQSQAFFYHHKNLPELMKELQEALPYPLAERLKAIGVSEKPCPSQDSYMPVFLAGTELGQSLAAALRVPLIRTTHQEGHLMAVLWDTQIQPHWPFFAFHLSGGTTDLMQIDGVEYKPGFSFNYKVLTGASDIPAGQLVDRVGVDLGLSFPAGPALEQLALKLGAQTLPKQQISASVHQGKISFSGAEAQAKKMLLQKAAPEEIARSVEHCIAGTLVKALQYYTDIAKPEALPREVIFMGGVAGNQYIRQRLVHRLARQQIPLLCYFAQSKFSSDNAVGVAIIAMSSFIHHNEETDAFDE